jgi:hypothetical protein
MPGIGLVSSACRTVAKKGELLHINSLAATISTISAGDLLETEFLERAAGIEPASSAWKAEVLPLHNARSTDSCPISLIF